jgi:hypothetical protein
MKNKNKFVQLKKSNFLENLTVEVLISQLIITYGDSIHIIKEATATGKVDIPETVSVMKDMALLVARLDIVLKRKNRTWWIGELDESNINLSYTQLIFISGLYLVSNPSSSKEELNQGINLIQRSIENIAYSFNLDMFEILKELSNIQTTTLKTEDDYAPEGMFEMSLVSYFDTYEGIKLEEKVFNTGVVLMDFFQASTHAINLNKKFGVNVSDELKNYIDNMDESFSIKFFNHGDVEDTSFYMLKTINGENRLFRGDEDITNSVSEEFEDATIIPFMDYSMVLVSDYMQSLDDLLDYYNIHKKK